MSKFITPFSFSIPLLVLVAIFASTPTFALSYESIQHHAPIHFEPEISYTVKEGDTLFGIAFSFNTTTSALEEWNGLTNEDIFVGQIVKVSPTQSLNGKTVAIDPGHGGYETGAIQNGIEEQDATLDVSLKLKRHLESEGAKVILTREDGLTPFRTLPLAERAATPLQAKADVFVSVHFNSHPDTSVQGSETYFNKTPYNDHQNPFPKESEQLAIQIQTGLVKSIRSKNLGTKENDFHVLRKNTVPSALVEVGFLSNQAEAERIKLDSYKEKSAYGITQGIIQYFKR